MSFGRSLSKLLRSFLNFPVSAVRIQWKWSQACVGTRLSFSRSSSLYAVSDDVAVFNA